MAKYDEWITEDGLIKLEGMARDGLTDEQIAKNIGIARGTLYTWKNRFSDINDSLKRGKEVIDREVENALLKKALGYAETLNKVKVLNDGTLIKYEEKATYQGDTTAMIFWLKNRKPAEWRDKQEVEHSGELGVINKEELIDKYLSDENGD